MASKSEDRGSIPLLGAIYNGLIILTITGLVYASFHLGRLHERNKFTFNESTVGLGAPEIAASEAVFRDRAEFIRKTFCKDRKFHTGWIAWRNGEVRCFQESTQWPHRAKGMNPVPITPHPND